MRIAVFAGSFDPFTLGHLSVVERALPLFDKLIIAVGTNADKRAYFSVDKRIAFIHALFREESRIEICSYSGLTVDLCRQKGAFYLLRGLRTAVDFEFERTVALSNKNLDANIETVFLLTDNAHSFVTSSVVREILHYGGDVSAFVPPLIKRMIQEENKKPI